MDEPDDDMEEPEEDTEDDEQEDDDTELQAQQRLIRREIQRLSEVETKRVLACCDAKNFVKALDRFYEGFTKTCQRTVEDFGSDSTPIAAACEEHKELLLSCADMAADENTLLKLVQDQVNNWEPIDANIGNTITASA